MRRYIVFALFSFLSIGLSAQAATVHKRKKAQHKQHPTNKPAAPALDSPWMTGPLLAPAGHTVPAGHINFEPYLFITDTFGIYNNHWKVLANPSTVTVSPTMVLSVGVLKRVDLQAVVPYDFNFKNSASDAKFGDTSLTLGFQALRQHGWVPNLRVTFQETFPTGKYEDLIGPQNGTDATGIGSFQNTFALNFGKFFKIASRYLRMRLSFAYNIPTSVHVTGLNSFGGGTGTNGTVNVGQKFTTDLGLEYALTQNWVPALDLVYSHTGSSTFRGTPGTTASGATASVGQDDSDQVSLAPAIEYNFSANLGVIAGAWFTIAGLNAGDFAGGVIALNYYH